MSDYIYYIDFKAIKLADLANELGDYKTALENYNKALERLRNYQGDSMDAIMMASGLVNKINQINNKNNLGIPVLKFDSWELTKSSFVKGNQCLKYLYLDKYNRQEKTPPSEEKKELFNEGRIFEELVRNDEFPGGINIKDKVGSFAYFNSYTSHILNSTDKLTIYEATIIEEDVLVMCDILLKDENGIIDIYEIKLNTEINDAIMGDLEIQYAICKKRFKAKLNSFNLILRSNEENKKWKIINLTTDIDKKVNAVTSKISEYKTVLAQEEPILQMGAHCQKPYECEFIKYCKKNISG